MEVLKNAIVEQIKTVFDPEIPVNIYDLGLIYEVNVDEKGQVEVIMTLTSPACPVAGSLPGEVEEVVMSVDGVEDAVVELVFDPPWDKDMMSDEAKFELGFD
jgi:FeS assembly SUF system protein